MVGYYSGETLPAPMQTSEESRLSVKRVVCSPDLPIPGFPGAPHQPHQEAASQPPCVTALQCPICQKTFASKTAFQTHQRTHSKETDADPYQCNICSKTFAVPARLTRHYRTHTGEKPFQCEWCKKSFSVKENLSVHRRIHTKERPYKCEVCARAFEHSGKLHRHMRIHTGERPHKCTVCNKTFIQSGQLVIHMRTHTGEKPYVCNVCSKGFTCSKQLKVHSRTHTGEKPYACDICGKSFGYNHVLKLHQVAHYGEKVYKCTICNDTFTSKKCMEAHIKSHSENATSPTHVEEGFASFGREQSPKDQARGAEQGNSSSESSCSSTSDKENTASILKEMIPKSEPPALSYDADIRYYLASAYSSRVSPTTPYLSPSPTTYSPSSGVELLAAAASATERAAAEDSLRTPEAVLNLISRSAPYFNGSQSQHHHYDPSLDHGNEIRRRVEAALAGTSNEEEPILTPPSSNPVSPAPSLSPEPQPVDKQMSLPMRKRSKMILKSMETTTRAISNEALMNASVRHSSVIHYARPREDLVPR